MWPGGCEGEEVDPERCVRRAERAGSGAASPARGVAQDVAVLLGHGRRGGLDQGEGAAHVVAWPGSRPHQRSPAAQQTQGAISCSHILLSFTYVKKKLDLLHRLVS